MARHREKDEEAGGEGLGRLQTRKRLWRDSNGAVVAKRRPELEKKRRTSGHSRNRNSSVNQAVEVESAIYPQNHAPISPPGSSQDHQSNGPDPVESSGRSDLPPAEELWPMSIGDVSMMDQAGAMAEPYDFLCNASWGSQPQESASADLLYTDLFAPDTASSFNNPFTTMSYYNWLLGNENWPVPGFDATNGLEMTKLPMEITTSASQAPSSTTSTLSVSDAAGDYGGNSHYYDVPNQGIKISAPTSDLSSGGYSREATTPETSAANQILAMSQMAESNFAASLGYQDASIPRQQPQAQMIEIPNGIPTPTTSRSSFETGRSKQSRRLPVINEAARQRVLDLISRARPKAPDETEITVAHELLRLSALQEYCDLYFKKFNAAYPLLHQATFEPSHVDPLLLTSVLLLGATYSDKDSHLFAICIHDIMRAQIFGSLSFNTRPKLWMLQTILLVECFGKSRAGQLQHDMSHLFHGLLINLIRRSDCQSARCVTFDDNDGVDIDRRWRAEVDAEQKRRLALLCFMWDTQHAVLFSQSLCMNAAELNLTLPWNEALWEAETPEEWQSVNSTEKPQLQYLAVLKTYFVPGPESRTLSLNALSRVLMLHGIMSVAWDLNRRDQTSLGLVATGKDEPWQSRIARSYDTWKTDFEAYSKATMLSLDDNEQEKEEFQRFCVATLAVYHASHIILQVEINDLQIFAGASHIIGRPVTKVDRERSKARIERWAKHSSISAARAGSHAARILRDGIRKLKDWDAGDYFHYPWCLYLAALTCWAFQMCSKTADGAIGEGGGSDTEEDSDWDARAEMSALVSAMTRSNLEDLWKVAGRYRTGDLPRVMSKHLSTIRWAVVQEGMKVLNGLMGKAR
ncbi:hypothetical protein EG329_007356 [Mollisiaceae sp. DMI_Dod_QoI]|nr:hypothetical protein EG329_007356 [Helotiales sp. DMI_Dod_QoI]